MLRFAQNCWGFLSTKDQKPKVQEPKHQVSKDKDLELPEAGKAVEDTVVDVEAEDNGAEEGKITYYHLIKLIFIFFLASGVGPMMIAIEARAFTQVLHENTCRRF